MEQHDRTNNVSCLTFIGKSWSSIAAVFLLLAGLFAIIAGPGWSADAIIQCAGLNNTDACDAAVATYSELGKSGIWILGIATAVLIPHRLPPNPLSSERDDEPSSSDGQ